MVSSHFGVLTTSGNAAAGSLPGYVFGAERTPRVVYTGGDGNVVEVWG